MKTRNTIALVAGLLALAAAPTVYSQLSATVQPGYVFEVGEYVTLSKLNAGFNPTVAVEGTVTGSTLGANSVTPANLTTNVFDQITLLGGNAVVASVNYDNLTLGVLTNKLSVLEDGILAFHLGDDSVTSDQVATNAIGSEWMVDTNVITSYHLRTNWFAEWINDTNSIYGTNTPIVTLATNDLVLIGDVSSSTNMALASVSALLAGFASSELDLPSGPIASNYSLAHGLGRTPFMVRAVLVCQTPEGGWIAGDEAGWEGVYNYAIDDGLNDMQTPYPSWGNSTNVGAMLPGNGEVIGLSYKTNSTGLQRLLPITRANWKFKIYAR